MYLLDTNALSLSSPLKGPDQKPFVAWLNENEKNCFLSVITLSEVMYGVEKARRAGATNKTSLLQESRVIRRRGS
jgi:predicted nucleic acid-binding protein